MRKLVLLAALALTLWPAHVGTAVGDDAVTVDVRIECEPWKEDGCQNEAIWYGQVELAGTYELTIGENTYELAQKTPLGALIAAADQAGIHVTVTDDYRPSDFSVEAVDGIEENGTFWWKHRVNLIETYYGPQDGWQNAEPELEDGDEVLWYLGQFESRPLRMTTVDAEPGCKGAASFLIEWPVVDVRHRANNPWPPPQVWTPAHGADISGDASAPAPAGAAIALFDDGTHTVWAEADEDAYPVDPIRSAPTTVTVDGSQGCPT